MTLKSDDGQPLEAKSGILLDTQGRPVEHQPFRESSGFSNQSFYNLFGEKLFGRSYSKLRVFRVSPWALPFLVVGMGLAFAIALLLFGVLFSLFLIGWIVRMILRAFDGLFRG
jgi:hypothetical protein